MSWSMKYRVIGLRALIIILTNETGFVRRAFTDWQKQTGITIHTKHIILRIVMGVQFQAEDTQQMANVSSSVQPPLQAPNWLHCPGLKLINFLKQDSYSALCLGRAVKRREMGDLHEYLFTRCTDNGLWFVCSQYQRWRCGVLTARRSAFHGALLSRTERLNEWMTTWVCSI